MDINKIGVKRLIINADDLGFSPEITRGIIEAHKSGVVSSTTAVVNMPNSAESLRLAVEEAPFLGLGLHINLTAGPPVRGDVDSLTDEFGAFLPLKKLAGRQASYNLEQVEREVRAQITQFEEWVGKPPDHLDAHEHIMYLDEALMTLLLDIARELNVPIRRPRADEYANSSGMTETLAMMAKRGIKTTDSFISRYSGANRVSLGDLLNALMDVGEGTTELMCHPGTISDESNNDDSKWRDMERQALTHPSTRELLIAQQISLITFAEL